MRSNDSIEEFLRAEERAWSSMDMRSFAGIANIFEYDPLMAKEQWEDRIEPMIHEVTQQNMPLKDVALALHNPSEIRAAMLFDLLMVKEAKVGTENYLRVFDFYDSVLRAICLEDRYTIEGKNIVHTNDEIQHALMNCEPADMPITRALGKLANACYSLSHGLYSDMYPQIVYENYGPYYQYDGSLVAIKTFDNLRPTELWPETTALPFQKIEVTQRMENVRMTMDMTSHAIYTGNQVESLRAWKCTADGKKLSLSDIDSLRKRIESIAIEIYHKTQVFTVPERKAFYCMQKGFSCKKLFDRLGLPWRPSEGILRAMEGDKLFDQWNLNKKGTFTIPLSSILDPREEIPDEAFRQ